jgi:hypothetical protein
MPEYLKPEKKLPNPKSKIPAKSKKRIEQEASGLFKLKAKTPIRKVSAKQAANLKAYEQGKRDKYSNEPEVCTGCGRHGQISCSHLVARSHSFELVSEKQNHEMQCFNCADLTERGQFFALKNGLKLLERLWNGLGEKGRQRFWYVVTQWPQNQDLWQQSQFFDETFENNNQ